MDERPNPLAEGCGCQGCQLLRTELTISAEHSKMAPWLKNRVGELDQRLVDLYGRKLLQRGWAGRTSPAEAAYVRAHAGWAQASARTLQRIAKPPDGSHAAGEADSTAPSREAAA